MPTKPNKAGQQQPYVPAGNGDASGEYGEHGTGSNRHYASPDDTKRQLSYGAEQPKQEQNIAKVEQNIGKQPQDSINYIHKSLDKGDLAPEEKNKIKEILSTGDNDCNKLIEKTLQNSGAMYMKASKEDYYQPKTNEIFLTKKTFEDKSYSKGGIFYHETGHMIDNNNEFVKKNDYSVKVGRYSYMSDTGASTNFVSEKYGTTIAKMLRKECKKNISFEAIKQEFNDYKQSIINNEMGADLEKYKEYKEAYKQIEMQEKDNIERIEADRDVINRDFWSGKISYEIYKERNDAKIDERKSTKDKYFNEKMKIQEKYWDVYEKELNAYDKSKQMANVKYGDISDVISGATTGRLDLGMGHSSSYWRKGTVHREKEFFAEAFSAKASNPESYEVLKKYLPKTVEIFEECLGVLGK